MRSPSAAKSIDAAQRAADQALDLDRAAVLAPARGVALLALARRGRQHPVLGRHPAAPLPGHPARHALLRRGRADHARLADRDQRRAGRRAHEARLDRRRAQLVGARARSCVSAASRASRAIIPERYGRGIVRALVRLQHAARRRPPRARPLRARPGRRAARARRPRRRAVRVRARPARARARRTRLRRCTARRRRSAAPVQRAASTSSTPTSASRAWPALAVAARVRALTVHGTDLRHPRTRLATAARCCR